MTETVSTPVQGDAPKAGLATRLIGVVFSPRDAYTAVAANPRWLVAMLVCVCLGSFLSLRRVIRLEPGIVFK